MFACVQARMIMYVCMVLVVFVDIIYLDTCISKFPCELSGSVFPEVFSLIHVFKTNEKYAFL